MKQFTLTRSREALLSMARFFAGNALRAVSIGDSRYAAHFARKAASRYFEAL